MGEGSSTRVTIVGAGLCGTLMACYLARDGYDITIYERRTDPREDGFIGGRSINLALSTRGITALREVGLADEVLKSAIPMPGRMIHSPTGKLTFQPYSSNPDDHINSVSRSDLNLTLINAASDNPNVKFNFDHRCTTIDFKNPSITFETSNTNKIITVETDRIIGADGAFSAVRLQMMLNQDRFEYDQSFLEHGYKELTIPPTSSGEFAIEPHALHIWPRGGIMMIALPNQDQSFTCTLFWPYVGRNSFDAVQSENEIRQFFNQHFPDVVPLMPSLVEEYQRNPVGSMVTIRCSPWLISDKAILIGDAAHAIVPFYGQGMNCAFEDCRLLNASLRQNSSDWTQAAETFVQERKKDADAIADMAIDNFIEMRDHTASRVFHLKKKMEHTLHRRIPRWYKPLYNMVTFSTMPYSKARSRERQQKNTIRFIAGFVAVIVLIILLWLALT